MKMKTWHIVPLLLLLAFAVWAAVDWYSRAGDMQMARLNADISQLADQRARTFVAPADEPARPAEEAALSTYAGALGDYRYQIDLPEGYRLTLQEGAMGDESVYVVMEPTPENETPIPDMVISLVSLKTEMYASRLGHDEPGTRLVPAADAKFGFWIRGWEDLAWPEFDRVAASFKAL